MATRLCLTSRPFSELVRNFKGNTLFNLLHNRKNSKTKVITKRGLKRGFGNTVLLKPVLGVVAGVALFITGHEQTQFLIRNRICYFLFLWCILASKRYYYSELKCI